MFIKVQCIIKVCIKHKIIIVEVMEGLSIKPEEERFNVLAYIKGFHYPMDGAKQSRHVGNLLMVFLQWNCSEFIFPSFVNIKILKKRWTLT